MKLTLHFREVILPKCRAQFPYIPLSLVQSKIPLYSDNCVRYIKLISAKFVHVIQNNLATITTSMSQAHGGCGLLFQSCQKVQSW